MEKELDYSMKLTNETLEIVLNVLQTYSNPFRNETVDSVFNQDQGEPIDTLNRTRIVSR